MNIHVPRKKAPLLRVLEIIKNYRKKNSVWFLIKWAYLKRPEPNMRKLDIPLFLNLFGNWDKNSHQLWGIYLGLKKEIGAVAALGAAYEIIKASDEVTEAFKLKILHQKFGENIPQKYLESKSARSARLRKIKSERLRRNIKI